MTFDGGKVTATYTIDYSQAQAAAAQIRALYQGLQQQTAPARQSQIVVRDDLSAVYLKQQQSAARLEAQQAQLARARGEDSGATALNIQAQQRLMALLSRENLTFEQSIAIQRQLASVQTQMARASQQTAGVGAQFADSLKAGLLGIVGPAALAATALRSVGAAVELAQLGAQADLVRQRFDALAQASGIAGDELLAALRKGSGREISDLNLQLAANKAQLLGVAHSAEEFGVLMVIARDRAQQMGITTTQAFDDLVTGLGRGSRLILDNLGILVDADAANQAYARSVGKTVAQLTDQERKQALINQVIAQGKQSIEETGGAVESASAAQKRLQASTDNVKAAFGSLLANGTAPFVNSLSDLINITDGSQESWASLINGLIDYNRQVTGLPPLTAAQTKAQQDWTRSVQEWIIAREVQLGLIDAQPVSSGGGGSFEFPDVARAREMTEAMRAQQEQLALTGGAYGAYTQAATASLAPILQGQAAIQAAAEASVADAAAKDAQQAKTALLADQTKNAASAFLALHPSLSATEAYAIAIAAGLGEVTAKVIAFRIEANKAKADLLGPTSVDKGEREFSSKDELAGVAAAAAASRAGALRNQVLQTGSATQVLAQRQQDYNEAVKRFGATSAQAIDAQTALIAAQQAAEKKGGTGRVSAAQSTALQLQNTEEQSQLQLARIQREGLERLRDQQEDFDVRRGRSQEDEDRKIRGLLARGQRAQAARERADFAIQQRREQEDFDRQKRRTLRNTAEGAGDLENRTDLRQQQIGNRAALRGVRPAGAPVPGDLGPLPPGAQAAPNVPQQPLTLQVQIAPAAVQIDGKTFVQVIWPTLEEKIDLALVDAIPPGAVNAGQLGVGGVG